MWTKKMLHRFPKRWRKWHLKNRWMSSPASQRLSDKRRKALADMGYRYVSAEWLDAQPKGAWVARVWDYTRLCAWVVRKK